MVRLKITLLLGGLTALVLAAGYYFGGQNGALIALILSAVMNFGSYWFSDKIVLALYGAKEIPREQHPKLHAIIEELAQKAKLPKPKICLVALPVPNAFATGRNEKHAVVAVTNGILQLLSESELRGVLAHELSHIKNRDILVSSMKLDRISPKIPKVSPPRSRNFISRLGYILWLANRNTKPPRTCLS